MKYWQIILTLSIGIPFYGSSQSFMNLVRDKVEKCTYQIKGEGIDKSLNKEERKFRKTGGVSSPNYNFILSPMINEL